MSARYFVWIADEMLKGLNGLRLAKGFRPIAVWPDHDFVRLETKVLVEDDSSPNDLEGKTVAVTFQREHDGTVTVLSREVLQP